MIKLIVDTTCDLNSDITDNYEVGVIPLNIVIGDKSYLDNVEMTADQIYEKMKQGIVPKTSQASYESITKAFDKCIDNEEDFIYLAFSSKMSGTYNFAKNILNTYKEKYPERKMAIVDSEGGCGGSSIMAIQILKMIEQGLFFETILEQIEFMKENIVYYFTVDDLEWLAKGGRVSKPLGFVGNKLKLKPYLTVKDGKMIVTRIFRGSKKVFNHLVEDVQKGTVNFKDQIIGISHSNDLDKALELEEIFKNTIEGCKTTIFQIGGVLGSHIGLGGVGIFFFKEKPKHYQF